MSEVSTGSAPHLGDAPGWAARPWARRAIPIVRGGLVLVWLVWAVLGWWSAPRPVGVDQARDDITAGRVGSAFRAEAWNDPSLWGGRPDASLRDDGLLLVWTTPAGQIRYTAPDLDRRPAELVGVGGSGSGTRTGQLAAELDTARTRPGRTTADYGPAVAVSSVLGGGLLMIFLGFLLAGPPPRRGTRLFWFWMALVPFGLGVLAWLATEAPWSRRVRRWADQPDADLPAPRPRRGGLFGFIAMFAVSFAVGLLIVGLRALLGPGLIPG